MFRKTEKSVQKNLFTSAEHLLAGQSFNLYEDNSAWHNIFRQQVTTRIDEDAFRPLFCKDNGAPNASIRVLISMMILKEAEGLSDQKLFENCRFNILVRSAIGLLNIDDPVPSESTYYLFRKRVNDYAQTENENLFDLIFSEITKGQSIEFEVSGKSLRMDSKLLGSNIAWLSRYELIHETLRLFYKNVKQSGKIDKETKGRLDNLLKMDGYKVVYTSTSEEVKSRLQELGEVIYSILPLFSLSSYPHYQTLQRVFNEQFKVGENRIVIGRNNDEISAQSVQSPHDTDCTFRNKDGNKVKGYSINVTESCDDDGLNLIGNVDVRKVSTSDVDFLQDDIKKVQEVFLDKPKATHADGAYHNPDNQRFCKEEDINLYLHAIQGSKGRYDLNILENGELSVFDTKTNEDIATSKVSCKKGLKKWRIKGETGYRYFTQENIDTFLIRKKIEETPIETLQKRNNVEATIFQLGYHYSNAKSRYRGLIKHQMWANIRCLWINFVRILKYKERLCLKTSFFVKYMCKFQFTGLCFVFRSFLRSVFKNLLSFPKISDFSLV